MFSNHPYSGFINFIYDPSLESGSCYIKDNSINQSLNGKVSNSYFSTRVSQVINDTLFNSGGSYGFSHQVGESYKKVIEKIGFDLENYKYCLSSSKVLAYIMDSNKFFINSMFQVEKIGLLKDTEIYQAKLDDYDDTRVLLFNDTIDFSYNLVRNGSSTYLYFNIEVNKFINNSMTMYYMLDDRVDKIRARWRKHKLDKLKFNNLGSNN